MDVISELKKMGPVFDLATSPSISNLSGIMGRKLCSTMPRARSRGFHFVMVKTTTEEFVKFGKWMVEGKLKAIIDTVFEFENVLRAYERLRTGRAKGKIIVHVEKK